MCNYHNQSKREGCTLLDGSKLFETDYEPVDIPPISAGDRGGSNRCEWCEKEMDRRPCAHWDQFCSCENAELAFANIEK